ncbi:MAG: ribose 5-phosphate isomerase B [Bacteroidota bacterium]|jgi:ribose 5-phosphate isomerase B
MITNQVSIGSDHAGFQLKEDLKNRLLQISPEFIIHDKGCFSDQSVDYPDYAHEVAKSVSLGDVQLGILICGSGNGVCMCANKHLNVRAALCWTKEIASLARQHNNANIICIPARFVSTDEAFAMVETFLKTTFEGGRHERRTEKIEI